MRTHQPPEDLLHLDANGLRFAALHWGTQGPLVMLVHGFPDTAFTWDHVGPALAAEGFRVVAPFTRGIAPSPIPEDGVYDSDTLGEDVIAWIDALGAQDAIVIGHDFGASAAYSAAGLHPDRVRKLVTLAIPHPATLKPTLGKLWGARHFFTHRLPGAAGRFAANDYGQIRTLYERWSPGYDWPESEFEATKNAYSAPGCCEAALAYYSFITPKPPPGQLAKLPMPSLVVGGHTDGVATEADFEASRRRFTGDVQVVMVPGGHFLHREDPASFLAVLVEFLKQ